MWKVERLGKSRIEGRHRMSGQDGYLSIDSKFFKINWAKTVRHPCPISTVLDIKLTLPSEFNFTPCLRSKAWPCALCKWQSRSPTRWNSPFFFFPIDGHSDSF
jgi:hypothetical protein